MNFNKNDDLMHQVLFHITCYERRKTGVQWLKLRMKAGMSDSEILTDSDSDSDSDFFCR